jgi:hypothetical protein
MDDNELNRRVYALDDQVFPFQVRGLENSGKIVPYIGWFWRDVRFDAPEFRLGYYDSPENEPFVGFMQNNKWGYPEFCITAVQTAQLRERLVAVVESPAEGTCQSLFDFMQTLAPASVR